MNEPTPKPEPNPKAQGPTAAKTPPGAPSGDAKSAEGQNPPKKLTPEEQMARFEDDLKENDWGHQPC